jgi:Domain of unknown function (DUF4279)
VRGDQYARFAVFSQELLPEEITEYLGIRSDQTKIMGSRSPGSPPVPRTHIWEISSDRRRRASSTQSPDGDWIPLSAHAEQIVDRLAPIEFNGGRAASVDRPKLARR